MLRAAAHMPFCLSSQITSQIASQVTSQVSSHILSHPLVLRCWSPYLCVPIGDRPGDRPMLDAAFKALAQMFTRPFRAVLWKSIGLATVLIIVVGIGLNHLLVWLAGVAQGWAEQTLGFTTNMPVSVLAWLLSFAAALGIIAGSVLLMPAVTALVASLFVD